MALLVAVFKPLAYISLPYFLLRSLAASSPTGRYYVRQGVYVGALMTVAACSAVVAAGMSLIGRRYDVNYVVAKTFYALTRTLLDVKVEVEGEEHLSTRPAVLMSNHQTMLDIIIVGRLMPKQSSIMSKKSLLFTPLGPFMAMSGAIFIDRSNPTRAIASLRAAGARMRQNRLSLWMFPEGTRTSTEVPNVRDLKKGGFHLAIQSGLPIIPIVTENYWRMYHRGVFDTGVIKVRVLPPISTTGLTASDIPELTARVRQQMLDTLREISVVPPGSKPLATSEDKSQPPPSPIPDTTEHPLRTESRSSATTFDSESSKDDDSLPATGASSASLVSRSDISENGADTEEDEGMILVDRPE